MNRDQDRYWLSLQQTVSRIVRDRAEGYDISEIHAELVRRLRKKPTAASSNASTAHQPPPPTSRRPHRSTGHLWNGPAPQSARPTPPPTSRPEIPRQPRRPAAHPQEHSRVPRPDLAQIDTLDNTIRQHLAWASIEQDAAQLNLDQHNLAVARKRLQQADQAVKELPVKATYKWILSPAQEPGSADILIDAIMMNSDGTLAARVTKAANSEFVVEQYAPTLLRTQIDQLNLWDKQPHIPVETLAGYFTDYLYMPRVQSHDTHP